MSVLAQLPVLGSTVSLREAVAEDVPALVQLLDLQPYLRAFTRRTSCWWPPTAPRSWPPCN